VTRAAAGTADTRISLSRRVFERIVRFLYTKKKVFVILRLKLPAGRLRPAAAVTPAPGEAPAARVPAGRGSGRLASVVTTSRCVGAPARQGQICLNLELEDAGGRRAVETAGRLGVAARRLQGFRYSLPKDLISASSVSLS
jgi:hypothetical protein